MRGGRGRRRSLAQDRQVKKEIRKNLQPQVRKLRKEIKEQMEQASEAESQQLAILEKYALGIQAVLNQDGVAPFEYAGIDAYDALDDIAASLERIKKRDISPPLTPCVIFKANLARAGTVEWAYRESQANAAVGARR
jgi:hypothetical protein